MQITTIKVNPRIRTTGSIGYQSRFDVCTHMTDAEIVAHATKVCTTDRTIDRAHILNHILNGNYVIERTH